MPSFFAALRDIAQAAAFGDSPTGTYDFDRGRPGGGIFQRGRRSEAAWLIEVLTKTLNADPYVLVILAMRSDPSRLFKAEPSLAALPKDTFTLDMMLEGSFRAVIEGPARLVEPPLRIDPLLTEALLEDLSGQDALPLLAFALALHLYEIHAADSKLTFAGYDRIGRVKGVIEKCTIAEVFAEAVARGEARLGTRRSSLRSHAGLSFRSLASVNAAGQFVRYMPLRDNIPAEARLLVDRFADRRLLTRDRQKDFQGKDVDVVEVAHEALLRQPPFSELAHGRPRVSNVARATEPSPRLI